MKVKAGEERLGKPRKMSWIYDREE